MQSKFGAESDILFLNPVCFCGSVTVCVPFCSGLEGVDPPGILTLSVEEVDDASPASLARRAVLCPNGAPFRMAAQWRQ